MEKCKILIWNLKIHQKNQQIVLDNYNNHKNGVTVSILHSVFYRAKKKDENKYLNSFTSLLFNLYITIFTKDDYRVLFIVESNLYIFRIYLR